MENIATAKNSFLENLKQPPKKTLPVYFPIIWAGRLLRNGFRRIWKSAIATLLLFVIIFTLLFFVVNLDLKPVPKIAYSNNNQSFAGQLASGDLKAKMGSVDVSTLSYDQWATALDLWPNHRGYDDDPDHDGLPNYLEYAHGTNPLKADTDGDGFSDMQEITNGYDPATPGDAKPAAQILISKIGVDVPMIWSQSEDEKLLDKDLESGVVHFPKTASPGQNGNMIVTGHSSNYIWAKGNYNHIFKDLNNLATGDKIDIKITQQNGRVLTYHYQVSEKRIASANDPSVFDPTPEATLSLVTCWPIGTNLRRLIVEAELVK